MNKTKLLVAFLVCVTTSSIGYALEGSYSAQEDVKIKRLGVEAEIIQNLRSIKTAEIAYESNFDVFVYASRYPSSPSDYPQTWVKARSGGFATMGWAPDGNVRGSYSVVTTTYDFTAFGIGDIDGDGTLETYKATKSNNPRRPPKSTSGTKQESHRGTGSSIVGLLTGYSASNRGEVEAEIIQNLKSIKTAEIAYESNFDVFVYASRYPSSPSDYPQTWVKAQSGGFATMGWAPDGDVRGSYSVVTTTTDFTAFGIGDVDGDGTLETYRATKSTNPRSKIR